MRVISAIEEIVENGWSNLRLEVDSELVVLKCICHKNHLPPWKFLSRWVNSMRLIQNLNFQHSQTFSLIDLFNLSSAAFRILLLGFYY